MKLPKVLTGLSLASKVLLSVGIATAATTGAGAAGVLPGPVQHAFGAAFDGGGGDPVLEPANGDDSTTTTDAAPVDEPTTVAPEPTTDTTEPAPDPTPAPEPTTVPASDDPPGDGNGDGNGEGDNPEPSDGPGDEHPVPETISLTCAFADGAVHCAWSGGTLGDGDRYILLRISGSEHGRAFFPDAGATSFDDHMVEPGHHYGYMVIIVHDHDTPPLAHSNRVKVELPGTPGGGGDGDGGGDNEGGDGGDGGGTGGDGPPPTPPPPGGGD